MALIRKIILTVDERDDDPVVKYVSGFPRQTDAVNEAVRQVADDNGVPPFMVRVHSVTRV